MQNLHESASFGQFEQILAPIERALHDHPELLSAIYTHLPVEQADPALFFLAQIISPEDPESQIEPLQSFISATFLLALAPSKGPKGKPGKLKDRISAFFPEIPKPDNSTSKQEWYNTVRRYLAYEVGNSFFYIAHRFGLTLNSPEIHYLAALYYNERAKKIENEENMTSRKELIEASVDSLTTRRAAMYYASLTMRRSESGIHSDPATDRLFEVYIRKLDEIFRYIRYHRFEDWQKQLEPTFQIMERARDLLF